MSLTEFLNNFDFDFKIIDNKIALIDLQGANLGNIEDERFNNVSEVVKRLYNYINDDQEHGIDYELEICGIDLNTIDSMNLREKINLAGLIGATVYDYYEMILNPSLLIL